jgi:SAM-dependent methyltransferase
MSEYWETRFQAEGKIWGESPSLTAAHALGLFSKHKVKTLLVPGSGYGRNTKFFTGAGLAVTGVEISKSAYEWALNFDSKSRFFNTSALDMSFIEDKFDAVYCFNVLHLFRWDDRKKFIAQCAARVKAGGLMYFTVFSEKEAAFGKGNQVEQNTFETKPGRPAHYFTESDLLDHFKGMKVLEKGITSDPENHGAEGPHTHQLRYICVKI